MATDAASTIAALQSVARDFGISLPLPPLPLRIRDGRTMIAPALTWERINNEETPQLSPVFPWRMFGIWQTDSLEIARNTYLYDPDAVRFRSYKGWKQDNIWAACLGLTAEARRLTLRKLSDGPYRFPAFWEAGFDWAPDLNRGGSAMIGLQEMLLQEHNGRIYLFPAWDKRDDVHFRLHATGQTVVEAELKGGKVTMLKVTPAERRKDVVSIHLESFDTNLSAVMNINR
jgi:hypothetical protein